LPKRQPPSAQEREKRKERLSEQISENQALERVLFDVVDCPFGCYPFAPKVEVLESKIRRVCVIGKVCVTQRTPCVIIGFFIKIVKGEMMSDFVEGSPKFNRKFVDERTFVDLGEMLKKDSCAFCSAFVIDLSEVEFDSLFFGEVASVICGVKVDSYTRSD
jgi:hypothetical protein